ncbi:MAG: hypothetical protein U0795_02455 [Pirellulales bacterium]
MKRGRALRTPQLDDGVPNPSPVSWLTPRSPIPITVSNQMTVDPGSTLQMVLAGNAWGSKIKSQPGIPVQLGGTLDLTFIENTPLALQSGRTIKVFAWAGVLPQGTFHVASQPGLVWDTSQLYTTGEVTLLGISSDLDADKDVDQADLLDFLASWTGRRAAKGKSGGK